MVWCGVLEADIDPVNDAKRSGARDELTTTTEIGLRSQPFILIWGLKRNVNESYFQVNHSRLT